MAFNVNQSIKTLLKDKLAKIESYFGNADIFVYRGNIVDGIEAYILGIIEQLALELNKKDRLVVILTTSGGSASAVERYVNIFRHNYSIVDFIVPDFAYSAGTILCMSGDNIYMDYSSVLGPIDPQVQNKDGKWVAALGYLDKVNEAIEKSRADTLTQVEYMMMKDLDLAELRQYEQAKDLTIDLLKQWLVKYKFKNWNVHSTNPDLLNQPVTLEQKQARATEIATALSNNSSWKSHSRPINIERLNELKLKIEDYSNDLQLRTLIRDYSDLLADYTTSNNLPIFVHTRKYI